MKQSEVRKRKIIVIFLKSLYWSSPFFFNLPEDAQTNIFKKYDELDTSECLHAEPDTCEHLPEDAQTAVEKNNEQEWQVCAPPTDIRLSRSRLSCRRMACKHKCSLHAPTQIYVYKIWCRMHACKHNSYIVCTFVYLCIVCNICIKDMVQNSCMQA